MATTTMRISAETKELIADRRDHPGEPLEDVIKRMMASYDMDRRLYDDEAGAVELGMRDIRAGRTIPASDLRKKLGL